MKEDKLLILVAIVGLFLLTNKKASAASTGYTPNTAATNASFYQSPATAAQIQSNNNQTASLLGGIVNKVVSGWMAPPVSVASNPMEQAALSVYSTPPGTSSSTDPFAAYSFDAVAANVAPIQSTPVIAIDDATA